MGEPKPLTFVVHDYHKLIKYLEETKQVSARDTNAFWNWWTDGDSRTGPAYNAIRSVPLGYWGWTREEPERQVHPDNYDWNTTARMSREPEVEAAVHRVLCALEQFMDKKTGNLKVWLTW